MSAEPPFGGAMLAWFRRLPVRARLAIWQAGAVGFILVLFAITTDVYLTQTTLARVDASLRETAQLTLQALADERTEEGSGLDVATADVVREVRYSDRLILIFDSMGRRLARSDSVAVATSRPQATWTTVDRTALAKLVHIARDSGAILASIGEDDREFRVYAMRTVYISDTLTVAVLRSITSADEVNEAFVGWLYASIPLALLLAGAGGYLLVRKSLAPALAMGVQAARIGSARLATQLDLVNPHDELGKLGFILNGMLERLHASFLQQRQFMSDASHELRTPIAVVRSAADTALQEAAPTVDGLRESLRLVSAEGKRLTRIVEDLFLLARTDSDEQPIHRELVFLEEILADVAKAGRALGRSRAIGVVAEVGDESPFLGDPSLLTRLLVNLVDNAIKHSPENSTVHLAIHARTDVHGAAGIVATGNWYRIVVEDSGRGVAPTIRDTLFDRFVRDDSARGRQTDSVAGGAGLGLSIARWIAESHAGQVTLESTSSSGSRFVVWLPQPENSLRYENPVE